MNKNLTHNCAGFKRNLVFDSPYNKVPPYLFG